MCLTCNIRFYSQCKLVFHNFLTLFYIQEKLAVLIYLVGCCLALIMFPLREETQQIYSLQ